MIRLASFYLSLNFVFAASLALSRDGSAQEVDALIAQAQGAVTLKNPTGLGLPMLAISSIERNPVAQDLSEDSILARHAGEACRYLGYSDYLAFTLLNSAQPMKVAELFGVDGPIAYTETISAGVELAVFATLTCVKSAKQVPAAKTLKLSQPTLQGYSFNAYTSLAYLNASNVGGKDLLPVANAEKLCSLLGYADVDSFEIASSANAALAWEDFGSRVVLEKEQATSYMGQSYEYAVYSSITCTQ